MTSESPGDTGQLGFEPRPHVQIARVIRARIDDGELKPGDAIRVASLTEEHDVSRQTVARGLSLLIEEGLLGRWPGHGYIVQRQQPASLAQVMENGMQGEPEFTDREKAIVSTVVTRLERRLKETAERQERLALTLEQAVAELQAATLRVAGILGQPGTADPEEATPLSEET